MRRYIETVRLCGRKTAMRRLIMMIAVIMIMMISCGKMDNNGDLGGNWQMVEWKDNATQDIKATNQALLFYTIHLNVIQFQDKRLGSDPHQALFVRRGDSLVLERVVLVKSNSDSLCTVDNLIKYGADGSGRFLIESLSDEHMILSNSKNTLKFRKY